MPGFPPGIYLCKVNNGNAETICELVSKLTTKTPERRQQHLFYLISLQRHWEFLYYWLKCKKFNFPFFLKKKKHYKYKSRSTFLRYFVFQNTLFWFYLIVFLAMSIFGVILVRISPYSDRIRRYSSLRIQFECGKMRTRKLRIRTIFTQCHMFYFPTD